MKLIDKQGYDNVTIEEISKNAGVSVGAFYHYYRSKTDIVVEFFKQIDVYYEGKREEILAAGDAGARLSAFYRAYAAFHMERGCGHTSTILKAQNSFFNNHSRYMYALLTEIVSAGRESGWLSKTHQTDEINDHLMIIARGLLFDWVLEKGEYDLTARFEKELVIALRGLRGETARK